MKKALILAGLVFTVAVGSYAIAASLNGKQVNAQACGTDYCE